MAVRGPICPASATLTDGEYRRLEALSDAAHQMRWELHCELEVSHVDRHCALGQQDGDDAWWLRWDDVGNRELAVHPPCPAHAISGDEHAEPCTLIIDHPGQHSFDHGS